MVSQIARLVLVCACVLVFMVLINRYLYQADELAVQRQQVAALQDTLRVIHETGFDGDETRTVVGRSAQVDRDSLVAAVGDAVIEHLRRENAELKGVIEATYRELAELRAGRVQSSSKGDTLSYTIRDTLTWARVEVGLLVHIPTGELNYTMFVEPDVRSFRTYLVQKPTDYGHALEVWLDAPGRVEQLTSYMIPDRRSPQTHHRSRDVQYYAVGGYGTHGSAGGLLVTRSILGFDTAGAVVVSKHGFTTLVGVRL